VKLARYFELARNLFGIIEVAITTV